jgi:uncharacterized membrane protein (GlpM family)
LALQAGSTSVVDGKAASSAKAPVLLGELCILLVSCTMALRNYSGPRTMFATVTFAIAIHLCVCAQIESSGARSDARAGVASQRERLRPRLAFLYALHWTVDLLELVLGGHRASTAVSIATACLRGKYELGLLFGGVLAMLAAERSRTTTRATLGWAMAGQTALAMRAYVVWHELQRSTDAQSVWRQGSRADEYAWSALLAQVAWPILAATLALAGASSCTTPPCTQAPSKREQA